MLFYNIIFIKIFITLLCYVTSVMISITVLQSYDLLHYIMLLNNVIWFMISFILCINVTYVIISAVYSMSHYN